jgi:hypothetical protein
MRRTNDVDVAVLMRGSHSHPRRGACLVELASTLPGGPWSDRPSSVAPALARIGAIVNDASSPAGRHDLVGFAPWLIGTTRGGAADPVGPAIASLAGRAALSRADPAAASRLAPALAELPAGPDDEHSAWSRLRRLWRMRRVMRLAVRIVGRGPDADDVLRGILMASINHVRRLDGLPELTAATVDGLECPRTLPVQVKLCSPDGGESTYFHCSAQLDRWPDPLRAAWTQRRAELAAPAAAPPGTILIRQ